MDGGWSPGFQGVGVPGAAVALVVREAVGSVGVADFPHQAVAADFRQD